MPRPLSVTVRKPSSSKRDPDMVGMAGHRLVHGVVEHLGEEMVHRLFVGAADIHAGAPAHRLEPFQHLDIGGGVARLARDEEEPRAAPCAGSLDAFLGASSSLANRSRDAAALRMGLLDTKGLHESQRTGNDR